MVRQKSTLIFLFSVLVEKSKLLHGSNRSEAQWLNSEVERLKVEETK